MVPPSTPLDLPALVALMYRADWTTLSLSATVTSFRDRGPRLALHPRPSHPEPDPDPEPLVTEESYQILLAPGGKYRVTHRGTGAGTTSATARQPRVCTRARPRAWPGGHAAGAAA